MCNLNEKEDNNNIIIMQDRNEKEEEIPYDCSLMCILPCHRQLSHDKKSFFWIYPLEKPLIRAYLRPVQDAKEKDNEVMSQDPECPMFVPPMDEVSDNAKEGYP